MSDITPATKSLWLWTDDDAPAVIPSTKHQWIWTADGDVRKSAPIPPEMQLTRDDVLEFCNEAQIYPDVARAFPHLAEQCEREIQEVIAHHDRWVRNYGIRKYIKHEGQWYAR